MILAATVPAATGIANTVQLGVGAEYLIGGGALFLAGAVAMLVAIRGVFRPGRRHLLGKMWPR